MKSLFTVSVPLRGEVPILSPGIGVSSDPLREKGSRALHNKKRGTWQKRSEAGRKKNVVKKRNTPKRVLTPGKSDPTAGHKKLYTRRRRKAE